AGACSPNPAAAFPTVSPGACRPTLAAHRTRRRGSLGGAGSAGGPSIQPCFGDGAIAAHDPQAQFDQLRITRIDLEARAQSVQCTVRHQRRTRDSAGGRAEVEAQAVDLLAGTDEIEQKDAPLAVETGAGTGGDGLP